MASRNSFSLSSSVVAPPLWWPVWDPDTELLPLTSQECRDLLGTAGTGRLSFRGMGGMTAAITRYEIGEDSAVLGPVAVDLSGSSRGRQLLLFQVDHVDLVTRRGWSVVLVDEASPAEYVHVGLESLAGRRISRPLH